MSQEELRRVKAQAIAGQVPKRDSLMGQAMEIGMLEAVGLSWRDEPKMMEMIRSVTADEVQSVAKRYFSEQSFGGDARPAAAR